MTADYLFIHAILITMRGNGVGILEDGAVAVTGNRISAVGATKGSSGLVGASGD